LSKSLAWLTHLDRIGEVERDESGAAELWRLRAA
jgi:hypothetical protein